MAADERLWPVCDGERGIIHATTSIHLNVAQPFTQNAITGQELPDLTSEDLALLKVKVRFVCSVTRRRGD